jgi:hypothetical protein
LRFTGTLGEAAGGELAPGQTGPTQTLDVTENPALQTMQSDPLTLTIVCADKFKNDYMVTVPVGQVQTPGGLIGLEIPWTAYSESKPVLGWWDYYRIGK